MKAVVLAGGHATRLWPLTKDRAKPLLPLAGKPIVAYLLDELDEIDAVDEVLISTNAKFADDFRSFVDGHGYGNCRIVVEEHTEEEEKIGSLGAILQVIEQAGADDYIVVGGDNYLPFALADFVSYAEEQEAVVNACYDLDDRSDATAFGVMDTDEDDRVTGFVEKPDEPPSTLVSTAVYFFPERQLEMFDAYVDAHQDSDADYLDEPGRLIEWGYDRYPMYVYAFDGDWYDIGTPQNYLNAQAALGDGQVDGTVTDSDLGKNVWVMDGAHVEESELEDCIVFPGAEISGSSLKSCIIDAEATVDEKNLESSVIGAHSTVR